MVTLRIALRYLLSKKSHSAVNVISIISMAGVAVATMAIVCVLSVFNGFSDLAMNRLGVIDPQLKVVPRNGKTIPAADSLAARLAKLPQIDTALATISEQALAVAGSRQMAVEMIGVPEGFLRVSNLDMAVIDGEYGLQAEEDSTDYAVLSVGTAVKLALRPDGESPLALYVPRRTGRINPSNPMAAFRSDSLGVAGVYELDETDKDAASVVVSLEVARRLLDYSDEASAIELSVSRGATEAEAKAAVVAGVGEQYRVMDRLEQEEQSFRMIAIEKWITFIMLAFILLIASFNIISTLSMLMIEKRDNMATLRALGARQSMIRGIFVWEGWLVSVIGGLCGLALGVVLCLIQQHFGLIHLSGDASQLSLTVYPVRVAAGDLLSVAGLVILTGLFISAVTARFAPRD